MWNSVVKPMLLKELNKPFNSNNYFFEIKYDGIRALMYVNNKSLKIINRKGVTLTNYFPEFKNIKELFNKNTIIDGEIIILDDKNKPSFTTVQKRLFIKDKKKQEFESINNKAIFVVFDILYSNKDLINLPLYKRKEILDKIKENDYLVKSKVFKDGIKLFNAVKKNNLEGIVAKRKDSVYEINKRSSNWIKIKNIKKEEFFIAGYILKKNNYLSVLLVEKKKNTLSYVGNASLTKSNKLYEKVLKSNNVKSSIFKEMKDKDIIFIKPKIMCIVKYLERTKNNHLRHPIIMNEGEI